MTFERLPEGRLLGYKVMRYDPDTNEAVSGADSRIHLNLTRGDVHQMRSPGIFLAADPVYVLDYYANHDYNALVTYSFDPANVTSGSLTDREPEITVSEAVVEDFEVYDEELEKVPDMRISHSVVVVAGKVYRQAAMTPEQKQLKKDYLVEQSRSSDKIPSFEEVLDRDANEQTHHCGIHEAFVCLKRCQSFMCRCQTCNHNV